MKTIGIKLADGSFYPVLEEDTAAEKVLELTTAHNNQTKIMVDLYRSKNCTMEDAEYVDSLQIESLNAHPNGEPTISFCVSIDEDNQLSARITDPETGKESDTTITLVSRTLEERLVTDEYNISDSGIFDMNENNDHEKEEAPVPKAAVAAVAGVGLLSAAAAINARDEEQEKEEPLDEIIEEPEIIDMPEDQIPDPETIDLPEDFDKEMELEPEDTLEEPVEVDEIEENLEDSLQVEDTPIEEKPVQEAPVEDFSDFSMEDTSNESTKDMPNLDDLDLTGDDISIEETTAVDNDMQTAADTIDFGDNSLEEDPTNDDSTDETMQTANDDLDLSSFDIPEDEEETSDAVTDFSTDLPDFEEPIEDSPVEDSIENIEDISIPEMPDDFFNDNSLDNFDNPSEQPISTANNGLSFTGLYDKETEMGVSGSQDEDIKKKTKVPVIICVICAIICIIATVLILFVIPSKYNLINKSEKETVVVEQPVKEQEPVIELEPEPIPEAKEDEVVIIEKAEEVVPEQPAVVEEKLEDISYKITWGDTLWDIADTYYKNPWRYKYIARYNGIKNPDHIVSGTFITIPAE